MSPSSWYQRTLLLNGFFGLVELLLHACALVAFALSAHHNGHLTQDRTVSLLVILFLSHLILRCTLAWSPRACWARLQRQQHGSHAPLLRDVALKRGTFPDNDEISPALMETVERWPKPRLRFAGTYLGGVTPLCLTFLLSALIVYLDGLPLQMFSPAASPQVQVVPPSYLQHPSRTLHPLEESISVYPGTLLKWENIESQFSLADRENRRYLARQQQDSRYFEARILNANTLTLSDSKGPVRSLEVKLLQDHAPKTKWLPYRKSPELQALSLAFQSEDDHGLEETLIVVNGKELEYAGQCKGKTTHQYRWVFDPSEHLPLLGGNIVLQIAAYDNDRVSGPKSSLSPAIVWEFPGIQTLADQALTQLQQLKEKSQSRMDRQQTTRASEVHDHMKQLEESLRQNPALTPDLAQMMKQLAQRQQKHSLQNLPQASSRELEELEHNEDILQHIENALEQVLSTIRASQMLSEMNKVLEQLQQGEHDPEAMAKLYEKLEEHLQKSQLPDGLKQHMLRQFNQAELSATMGDTSSAAESLEKLMDVMQQEPQASQGPNPLAEKFQNTMKELDNIIQEQGNIQQSFAKKATQMVTHPHPKAKALQDSIVQHPHWKTYDQVIRELRQNQLNKVDQRKLIDALSNPNSDAQKGRRLQQMHHHLSQFQRGQALPQLSEPMPWAPNIEKQWHELNKDSQSKAAASSEPTQTSIQQPNTELQNLSRDQQALAQRSQSFDKNFKLDFEPVLRRPEPFTLSARAAGISQKASQALGQGKQNASILMNQSRLYWVQLKQWLEQLQQQGQGAGQSSPSQPQLSLGKDGKLQLSPQGQAQEQGDGEWRHKNEDLDIALPEEFQNSQNVERRLREALKETEEGEQRDLFRQYIMELLE